MGPEIVRALKEISFDVNEGEFLTIMGSSGSGKTTLLNILGCLDKPTDGNYLLDGVNVKTLSRDELARFRNNKIGFVFQSYNLLPRTTALENVELPLLYNPLISAKQRREICNSAEGRKPGRTDEPFAQPAFRRATTACGHSKGTGK